MKISQLPVHIILKLYEAENAWIIWCVNVFQQKNLVPNIIEPKGLKGTNQTCQILLSKELVNLFVIWNT